MSRRSRRTRAATSISARRWSATAATSSSPIRPGARTSWRGCARSGIEVDANDPKLGALLDEVKAREFEGYAYDGAEASFELLARRALGSVPELFPAERFRVIDERRWNAKGRARSRCRRRPSRPRSTASRSWPWPRATARSARSTPRCARRWCRASPRSPRIRLADYKVRILTPQAGTGAVTRVMIESADEWRELVHRRRLDQHHRRLLQRAARQHHLQALARRRAHLEHGGTDVAAGEQGGPAIILVAPQLGENIGTAARAMFNCG